MDADRTPRARLKERFDIMLEKNHPLQFQINVLKHQNAVLSHDSEAIDKNAAKLRRRSRDMEDQVLMLTRERDTLHVDQVKLNEMVQKRKQELHSLKEQAIASKNINATSNRPDASATEDSIQTKAIQVFSDLQSVVVNFCRGVDLHKSESAGHSEM